MKTTISSALFALLALPHVCGSARAADNAFLEFLWAPTPTSALARSEAFGFTLDPSYDHRICVSVAGDPMSGTVNIEAIDASGELVSKRVHQGFNGSKRCYKAELGTSGAVGPWTFNVYVNEVLAATRTIEVARTVEEASFYTHGSHPYVLGRPNYDPAIPPEEYTGRLVWVMHVDVDGSVKQVDVESAEGAGALMKERAVAAGLLTRFPPDPSRSERPLKIRQEYDLATE